MDIQLFTLLAAIVTIITGLLSLNEKMMKVGLVKTIQVICCYCIPIIFIQQIYLLYYDYRSLMINILFLIWVLVTVYALITYCNYVHSIKGIRNRLRIFFKDNYSTLIILFIPLLVIIANNFIKDNVVKTFIPEFTIKESEFITKLRLYHINLQMFTFLKDNLLMALCFSIDIANILAIFFSITSALYYVMGKSQISDDLSEKGKNRNDYSYFFFIRDRYFKLIGISFFISSGIPFILLRKTFELF